MNSRTRCLILTALAIAGVAACGSDDQHSESSRGSTSRGSSIPAGAARLVDVAVRDLLGRLALSEPHAAAIEIVAVEEVTWRDRSLGCPMKGMQYAQVLTPGTRIVLVHDGTNYEYHAGGGRDPFYCPRPESPAPN